MTDEELIDAAWTELDQVPATRTPAMVRSMETVLIILRHLLIRHRSLERRLAELQGRNAPPEAVQETPAPPRGPSCPPPPPEPGGDAGPATTVRPSHPSLLNKQRRIRSRESAQF